MGIEPIKQINPKYCQACHIECDTRLFLYANGNMQHLCPDCLRNAEVIDFIAVCKKSIDELNMKFDKYIATFYGDVSNNANT